MKVSIFGFGYVGAVTAACFARDCHDVIGVDPDDTKRGLIERGESPIVEPGLAELIKAGVDAGKIRATDDPALAVAQTDLSLICVGTPSTSSGTLDTRYVQRVAREIGEAIRDKPTHHSVVLRSTVLPGTTADLVRPILEEASGKRDGVGFGLSFNPEFLREGRSIYDFDHPPYTVIGAASAEEFDRVCGLYRKLDDKPIHVEPAVAEALKYACNAFHAMKITFANEVGKLCRGAGVDGRAVMDLVASDDKLNISRRYLMPGFAFGGSCLPKDLRAMTAGARLHDATLPMMEAMLASNRAQVESVAKRVMKLGKRKLGLLGLSFKPGTDDLRESPYVTLAEMLLGRGYDLLIADPNVQYATLHGGNKRMIEQELPHLQRLLVTQEEAVDHAEVVLVSHDTPEVRRVLRAVKPGQVVFDLVGVDDAVASGIQYEGIYW